MIIHINNNTPTYPSKSQFNYYLILARKDALSTLCLNVNPG